MTCNAQPIATLEIELTTKYLLLNPIYLSSPSPHPIILHIIVESVLYLYSYCPKVKVC